MRIRRIAIPFFMTIMLVGCVSEVVEHDFDTVIDEGGAYESEVKANEEVSNDKEEKADESNIDKDNMKDEKLKILSTYRVSAESDNFNDDLNEIVSKTHDLGGYVSSNEVETKNAELSSSYMESKLMLRIPRQNVIELVDDIKDIVHVRVKSLNSIDVTDRYYDINSKIKGLEMREKRLHELYANAMKIDEIIEIESELAKIESIREEEIRNKAKIEDRIKFSSIEVNLKEVKSVKRNETSEMSSNEKISYAFKSTSSTVTSIVVGTLVFIMRSLPVAILTFIVIVLYRKFLSGYVKKIIAFMNRNNDEDL